MAFADSARTRVVLRGSAAMADAVSFAVWAFAPRARFAGVLKTLSALRFCGAEGGEGLDGGVVSVDSWSSSRVAMGRGAAGAGAAVALALGVADTACAGSGVGEAACAGVWAREGACAGTGVTCAVRAQAGAARAEVGEGERAGEGACAGTGVAGAARAEAGGAHAGVGTRDGVFAGTAAHAGAEAAEAAEAARAALGAGTDTDISGDDDVWRKNVKGSSVVCAARICSYKATSSCKGRRVGSITKWSHHCVGR